MSDIENSKKQVCILSFSNIARDGRVLRQINFISNAGFKVDVIGNGNWIAPSGVKYYELQKSKISPLSNFLDLIFLLLGRVTPKFWEIVFWRKKEYLQAKDLLVQQDYDLIHANDWDALPVACFAYKISGVPILFDAHEYTLEQERDVFRKKFLRKPYQKYFLKTYGDYFAKMVTVSEGIRGLYAKNFGWDSQVVRNVPGYKKHKFRKVNPNHIKLIHHGGAIKGRNIESLIQLMSNLDKRFYLYLMLVQSNLAYFNKLKTFAQITSPDRIVFLNPVTPDQISDAINEYDIGIHLMKADNLNHYHALPNKLFEFIMAGLTIATYPLPDMAKLIQDNNIGFVSQEQTEKSMAKAINDLEISEIEFYKSNSLKLAKELNAETEMDKLIKIYNEILAIEK
jgi:glycosyltransferase involved in cell wall biosynthesis